MCVRIWQERLERVVYTHTNLDPFTCADTAEGMCGSWSVALGADGSLAQLENAAQGIVWASANGTC